MNKLSEILEEVDKEFDEKFICQIPEHLTMSDHVFAHDKAGKLPQEFKQFYHSKIKEILTAVIEAAPKEADGDAIGGDALYKHYAAGFNGGRALTIQAIKDWRKGE